MIPVSKAISVWLEHGITHGTVSPRPGKHERKVLVKTLCEVFSISTRRAQERIYEKFGPALTAATEEPKEVEKQDVTKQAHYRRSTEERVPVLTDELSRRLFRTAVSDYAARQNKEEEVYARLYGYVKDGTAKAFNTRSREELAEAAAVIYLRTDFEPFLQIYDILSGRKKCA